MDHCENCKYSNCEMFDYPCSQCIYNNGSKDYFTQIDIVNSPPHYTDGKIEVIDYIEDKKLGFCLGNAIKYISRAGKKDPSKEVEDLKKAKWYIERRIKELEEAR